MGRTPVRGRRGTRTLSSSSGYESTRNSGGPADEEGTQTGSRTAAKAMSRNKMHKDDNGAGSSDVEMLGLPETVDTADEGDEEFVQTSSESDLDEEDEEKELDYSSESNSLTPHSTRRRTSMRLGMRSNDNSETRASSQYSLHQRLRQSLRLRDQKSPQQQKQNNEAADSEVDEPLTTRSTRRRRVTHGAIQNIRSLFEAPSGDQNGYASSPTASASRRLLRRGHTDNVHRHSSLRNQMPQDASDVDTSNSDGFLSMKIDSPSNNRRSARGLTHKAEDITTPSRKRIAPALISPVADQELAHGGALSALSPPRPQSRQQRVAMLPETPISPPPIIDKPREERSYKEFFPDLNVFAPMAVRCHSANVPPPSSTTLSPPIQQKQQQQQPTPLTASSAEDTNNRSLSAVSSAPLTSLSSMPAQSTFSETLVQEPSSATSDELKGDKNSASDTTGLGDQRLPQPSRSSSGLSIKLIFSDPEAPPITGRHHTASLPAYLGMGVDPFQGPSHAYPFVLRPSGPGKSPTSYSGTPQSSVVVLAPKKPVLSLPDTRFRRLEGKDAQLGYRPAEFKRPEGHYIRNIELTEKDLAERIEYDLDDSDHLWLQRLNKSRAAQGSSSEISSNLLELIIDHLEKEWFELVKEAQRAISAIHQNQLSDEDSACAICGEEEGDNTNGIVFCDGCNLAVHQECYGIPYIPEGSWLCRKCILSPDKEVTCILCPQRGGAFKKTTTNKWAHLLCAAWIPEVGISNTVYMEPIDSVDQIPRSRWKLLCCLCHRKTGACIQCSHRQCFTAFHVTCARKAHLSMTEKLDRRTGEVVQKTFCERHTPATHAQEIDLTAPLEHLVSSGRKSHMNSAAGASTPKAAALSLLSSDLVSMLHRGGGGSNGGLQRSDSGGGSRRWPVTSVGLLQYPTEDVVELFRCATSVTGNDDRDLVSSSNQNKASEDASLQLTMRIFNPGRPVLNEYVFAKVLELVPTTRIGANQRVHLLGQVARYWALKRLARHGAPLLKRLHLEPWTASATQQNAIEMAEEQRQLVIRRIRTDLERVRLLVESVRRREREKLKGVRALVDYLRLVIDPLQPMFLAIVDDLIDRRDPRKVLSTPVTLEDAPDYFDVIKEPIDFGIVRQNIRDHKYVSLDDLERDLNLVVANCMTYNKPTTYYYQLAARIKRHVERQMAEAREKIGAMPVDPEAGHLLAGVDMGIFDFDGRIPSPPSPLHDSGDDGDDEDGDAAAGGGTKTTEPGSDAEDQAEEKDASAADKPEEEAEAELPKRSKRNKNETPPSTPKKSSADKRAPASEPRITRAAKASESKKKASRRKTHGPATTTPSSSKGSRQLTLFEQLSVPPPDVRHQLRERYATVHPNGQLPDDDIPDDVNVLKDRLRRTSMIATPTETPTKKTKIKKSKRSANDERSPSSLSQPGSAKKQRIAENSRRDSDSGAVVSHGYAIGIPLPTAEHLGEDPSRYPAGTPVWAKMASYPWFPAEICDPQTADIPDDVQNDKQSGNLGSSNNNTLVRFFSSKQSSALAGPRLWKWLAPAQVCKLGVDKPLDEMFFKAQKAKSSSMAKKVRHAYAEACRSSNIQPLVSSSLSSSSP
ncbi:hypothetical protein GGH99_004231 [Coemansia sp. RSA 1285]|nr:hypothetical protein GGH99_004231 [Coemansia sp. RSA 1285]